MNRRNRMNHLQLCEDCQIVDDATGHNEIYL